MERATWVVAAVVGASVLWVVLARAMEIGDREMNLLENPSFESTGSWESWPSPWLSYSYQEDKETCPTEDFRRTGMRSMRLEARGTPGDFQGVIQLIPVTGGDRYTFTAYLMNDRSARLGGSAYLQLVIEWRDEGGTEVARDFGAERDGDLSPTRWNRAVLNGIQAPTNAVQAVVGIHLFEGGDGGKGAVLVDDVELVRVER